MAFGLGHYLLFLLSYSLAETKEVEKMGYRKGYVSALESSCGIF